MVEMLIDTPCFRRCAGIDMIEDRIPDETTILKLRHLLEEHKIAEQILESVNQSLIEKGVMLKEDTIPDATFINAHNSTFPRAQPERAAGTRTRSARRSKTARLTCASP